MSTYEILDNGTTDDYDEDDSTASGLFQAYEEERERHAEAWPCSDEPDPRRVLQSMVDRARIIRDRTQIQVTPKNLPAARQGGTNARVDSVLPSSDAAIYERRNRAAEPVEPDPDWSVRDDIGYHNSR